MTVDDPRPGAKTKPFARVTKGGARAALAALVCPKCGNSSETVGDWRSRQGTRHQGISCYYTERVYHAVLGDFRGATIKDDDNPDRCDAPDSAWVLECNACHHEWPMGEHDHLYAVAQELTHEARVARLKGTHNKVRLAPQCTRPGDFIDDGLCQLLRVMADPLAKDDGTGIRVPYYMVDDPLTPPDRARVSSGVLDPHKEYDVYRPLGPPECVPADVVAALEGYVRGHPMIQPRLLEKVVTQELGEHFTPVSVVQFMAAAAGCQELRWHLLEYPSNAEATRAIDL